MRIIETRLRNKVSAPIVQEDAHSLLRRKSRGRDKGEELLKKFASVVGGSLLAPGSPFRDYDWFGWLTDPPAPGPQFPGARWPFPYFFYSVLRDS
jgi:hypothetical protein